MSVISAQLNNILETFAASLPGGTSDPTYLAMVDAIRSSSALTDQMNAAVAAGHLDLITYVPGNGGDFDSNRDTIELGQGLLQGLITDATSSDPQTAALGRSSLISLLAHETSHSSNSDAVQQDQLAFLQMYGVPTQSSANSWIAQYREIGLADEGRAVIRGWNDAVEAAIAANGGPLSAADIQLLAKGNAFAYLLFNANGDNSVSPIAGISLGADGTIDLASSLAAASSAVRLVSPSTAESPADYLLQYTQNAINQAGALTTDAITLSYQGLGLTVPSVSPDINHTPSSNAPYDSETISEWLAAGTFSQKTVVVNADDHSTATFEANAGHTGTTLTYVWDITEDGTQSYEVLDIGASGTANFGHIVTTQIDGNANVTVLGHGDTVTISYASILLMADTQATVIGDHNAIGFNAQDASTLALSGTENTVAPSNHAIRLLGTKSSVTLDGSYGMITLTDNEQTVTLGQGQVTLDSSLEGIKIVGVAGGPSLVNVQAGTDDEVTIENIGVSFNGGRGIRLHATDASYAIVTAGEDSHVDVTVSAQGYAMLTAAHGVLALAGKGYGSVTGSDDTVTVDHLTNLQIRGDRDIVNGSADMVSLYGNDNTLVLDDGAAIYIGFGSSGNIVDASHATISVNSGNQVFNGSFNDFSSLTNGTFAIVGDSNSLEVAGASLELSGSNNIVDGYDTTLHLNGGSGNDIQLHESTITAVDNMSLLISGDRNVVTAGTGSFTIIGDFNNVAAGTGTFEIYGDDDTVTAGDDSSVTITGVHAVLATNHSHVSLDADYIGLTLAGTDNIVSSSSGKTVGLIDVTGGGNHILLANAQIYLHDAQGVTDIGGSGDTVYTTGATLHYTGDSATGVHGARAGIIVAGHGNTVLADESSIRLLDEQDNPTFVVSGAGNEVNASYATVTLKGAGMSKATTFSGISSTVQAETGYYAIDGAQNEVHLGDGSHVHATSDATNILYLNNATIDLDNWTHLTVYGSNNTFVGGSNTYLTITGTNNSVTTTSSYIEFLGENTGDVVFGAGNNGSNWSAPDPDLPPGEPGGHHPPSSRMQGALDSLIQAMASFDAGSDGFIGIPAIPVEAQHTQLAVTA